MLSFFLSSLLLYKYAILFVVIACASFGFPIPATALLMAAGAFAAQGYLDLGLILVCALTASVLGDIASYAVSSRYGTSILKYVGLSRLLRSARFRSVESLFARYSVSTVFMSRFLITSIGPIVNILSGLSRLPIGRFTLAIVTGEILYVCIFAGLGYLFSDQWEAIWAISQDVTTILVLATILAISIALILRRKKHRKS